MDNDVMHAKPDLRVFLKWVIARSGSVITDVMSLEQYSNGLLKQIRSCDTFGLDYCVFVFACVITMGSNIDNAWHT